MERNNYLLDDMHTLEEYRQDLREDELSGEDDQGGIRGRGETGQG